ncbi:MAG: hypothetical protein KAQ91_06830 [Methylococcales bacterium]|nr:hypothetical protein [Methylococcales bacterium]
MNTIPQPSTKSLIWSCICSLLLAIFVFIAAVLPAEFNIDPTGLGKSLGLTVLSQSAVAAVVPAVISCPSEFTSTDEASKKWQDIVMITIPPKKGLEYKFNITKGETLEFVWNTQGSEKIYFDFHGDPEGATNGYFKSFKESTQSESSGSLLAPFTGKHGWYWENKSNQTVIINLKTRGNYKIIGLL